MKATACALLAFTISSAVPVVSGARYRPSFLDVSRAERTTEGKRTISKVVKLLKKMLEDSRKEADEERTLYAKFKCYCNQNEKEKTESIETLTKQIGLLEAKIEELQGSNGMLSSEIAQLQAKIDANKQMLKVAESSREDEKKAFEKGEEDMTKGLDQMGQAIDILVAIGADQSLAASAEHQNFMAGYKAPLLLKLKTSINEALLAADTFLTPNERSKAESLLQAPLAGAHATQSGEIVGILKKIKETFKSNLESARSAEKAAVKAHEEFVKTKEEAGDVMDKALKSKEAKIAENDESLGEKKEAIQEATKQKADDEAFLDKLMPMCETKAKEFEQRNLFRANEEAAISEAIAILDSDEAFDTFGKVKATSEGATGLFLQLSMKEPPHARSPRDGVESNMRQSALQSLERVPLRSSRIMQLQVLLRDGNPFTKVLDAIDAMKQVIEKEGEIDDKQLAWCKSERKESEANQKAKKGEIKALKSAIAELESSIDHPETGLKVMIEKTAEKLAENQQSQEDETKVRKEENSLYQKNVYHTAEAAEMLQRAIAALEKYYAQLEKENKRELELAQEDPAPPETWSGEFKGQGGQGNKVIEMLKFVLKGTEDEETQYRADEKKAQSDFEASMKELKKSEDELLKSGVKLKKELADAEKNLVMKQEDLEKTQHDKAAIDKYLETIKPGCDFITDNYDDRVKNRAVETKALDKAAELLKGTPAYKAAAAKEDKL
mmetsp:Transcript_95662/g.184524  ORF Transcript_95662/g.184524 Transcript_95662/m.184524 type:complete len:726 (+) Transcript_95662:41-2218(+)